MTPRLFTSVGENALIIFNDKKAKDNDNETISRYNLHIAFSDEADLVSSSC